MIDVRTEPNIDKLRSQAILLDTEVARLRNKNLNLTKQLAEAAGLEPEKVEQLLLNLREQLDSANAALFGRSSEKRPRKPPEDKKEEPQTGHGPTDQPKLPIEEKVHNLDRPDTVCPKCGKDLSPIEGMFEDSEEITVVKVDFRVIRHRRQKYRCSCCSHMETALGPEKLVPGGRYSVDFACHVAVGKYADHLPLDRQVDQMARSGLVVTTQALWDQTDALARFLEPTYEAHGDYVRAAPVIGLDDTRWPVSQRNQDRETWNVWTITRPDAVFHRIDPSRSAQAAAQLIKDFSGTIMADGYKAHEALLKLLTSLRGRPAFVLAQCWAHVRRKFFAARKDYPEADKILDLIDEIYAVEREASRVPPESRLGVLAGLRASRSAATVKKIHDRLVNTPVLPSSSIGKAVKYALAHWDRLKLFLTDPLIPVDNNATERALRGPVVGRKNYYGSRSRRGTEVAALFYSLIDSAKLVGLDPAAYLSEAARRAIRNPGTVYLPVQMVADLAKQADPEPPADPTRADTAA